jgi:uncharacterized phiE125 gp8 family phage protein
MVNVVTITPPATEPVSVDEVKLHLRLDPGDHAEDSLLALFIAAAREHGEDITRLAFATRTLECILDDFPPSTYLELPKPPLASVTSIKYKNADGVEVTMAVDTDYLVDTSRIPGRILTPNYASWPYFVPYANNPIKIRYVAGYASGLPMKFKQAMLLHVGFLYKARDMSITPEEMETVNGIYRSGKTRWL